MKTAVVFHVIGGEMPTFRAGFWKKKKEKY